ncbi:MAG: hypothetical protein HUU15_13550 [Candidatus Brocadiae bacterium]|nr:hypothetical protein [Candidatus Brocadiia bacterium]
MTEPLIVPRAGRQPGLRENRRGVPRVEGRVPVEECFRAQELEAVRVGTLRNNGGISAGDVLIKSSKLTGGHR